MQGTRVTIKFIVAYLPTPRHREEWGFAIAKFFRTLAMSPIRTFGKIH